MHILIGKKSISSFDETVKNMQSKWPNDFVNYFNKHIRPAIVENLEKRENTEFAYFKSKSTTSNPVESWNSMIQSEHSKYERIHMRVDQITLHLYISQLNILDEINRAFDNEGGEFVFKPEVLKSSHKIDLEPFDKTMKDIMTEVKAELEQLDDEDQIDGADNTTEKVFAKAAIKHDLVTYLGKCDSFIVQHPLHRQQIAQVVVKKGKFYKTYFFQLL